MTGGSGLLITLRFQAPAWIRNDWSSHASVDEFLLNTSSANFTFWFGVGIFASLFSWGNFLSPLRVGSASRSFDFDFAFISHSAMEIFIP